MLLLTGEQSPELLQNSRSGERADNCEALRSKSVRTGSDCEPMEMLPQKPESTKLNGTVIPQLCTDRRAACFFDW